MSLLSIKNKVDMLHNKVFYVDKDKWRLNWITILYSGEDNDINNNKKYRLEYEGKKLVYDNIEDFYKEYNGYPKKDINPQIIEVVDNSYLEKYLYLANEEG